MSQNPRLSLTLHRVTATEALAALAQRTGLWLELPLRDLLAKEKKPAWLVEALQRLAEDRASFTWDGVPFAAVLRELCDTYGLSFNHCSGGYHFLPREPPPPGPVPNGGGIFQGGGVRVYPHHISVLRERTLWFTRPVTNQDRDVVMLAVGCEIEDGDGQRIAGVEAWEAEDDLGKCVSPKRLSSGMVWSPVYLGPYPDQWRVTVPLDDPSPGATRLAWVKGDLLVWESYYPFRVEFPLPLPEGGARQTVGDIVVELLQVDGGKTSDENGGLPLEWSDGPSLRARIYKPADVAISSVGHPDNVAPVLFGASGRPYDHGGSYRETSETTDECVEVDLNYGGREDRPARVLFDLVRTARPEKLLTFTLTDIPIP